jgi:hypothetical protein
LGLRPLLSKAGLEIGEGGGECDVGLEEWSEVCVSGRNRRMRRSRIREKSRLERRIVQEVVEIGRTVVESD